MRIGIVGCGFLGSLYGEELAKTLYAMDTDCEFLLVDDDEIDSRNPANHLFVPMDEGKLKVDVLADRMRMYGHEVHTLPERIDMQTVPDFFKEAHLLIDAVDNIPTRQMLWALAKMPGDHSPMVLHLGLSQLGTGAVEWTTTKFDNFSLSPVALAGLDEDTIHKMGQLKKLKPCDLVVHRGVGLNTAVAATKSTIRALGLDGKPLLQSWQTDNEGHRRSVEADV